MNISLFELFQRGGPVMWANLFCSIIVLAIALERSLAFYRADVDYKRIASEIKRSVEIRKLALAEKLCDENPAPLTRVIKTGIQMYGHPRAEILEAMDESVSVEVAALQRYIPLLGSVAHSALLLGLLGTVIGLIRYFQIIQLKATTLNPVSPGDLAGGIWEALLNTVFGLIVAIPAYALYNYFAHRANSHTQQLESAAASHSRLLSAEHQRAIGNPSAAHPKMTSSAYAP